MQTGSIYALSDPRDATVHYVGQTICPLKRRLWEHVNSPTNARVRAWMEELLALDLRPNIALLETVRRQDMNARERFWIKEMHLRREPLCQLADADTLSELFRRGMFFG